MAEVGLIVALAGGEPERELLLLWLAFGVAISSPTRAFMVWAWPTSPPCCR